MNKRGKIILTLVVVVLATSGLATRSVWRTASLYWAKASARRTIGKFSPEELRFLNATPTSVELPAMTLDSGRHETVQLGGYEFQVPRPTSHADNPSSILLVYPRYEVRIRRPFLTARSDSVARQLHFKDIPATSPAAPAMH